MCKPYKKNHGMLTREPALGNVKQQSWDISGVLCRCLEYLILPDDLVPGITDIIKKKTDNPKLNGIQSALKLMT